MKSFCTTVSRLWLFLFACGLSLQCVCVCLITSDKWKEKKKLHSWPLQWGKHGSGTVWSSSAGFLSTQSSQWFSNCGWPWEEKKLRLRQISDFYRKQTKKVHSYFVSLQRCIQLKFKFISPSHPIPGLLHYSHESSLKSFSFPLLLPRSTIFIILCPTDLLLSPLNVSKPSHPQLSTFSVRAVPLLHSFL